MSFKEGCTVDNFLLKVQVGESEEYQLASMLHTENRASKQKALVGTSKDTHAGDVDDTRALMVHFDDRAKYNKLFVAEPNELTMQVERVIDTGPNDPLALIKMTDSDEEILLANGYGNDEKFNVFLLGKRVTLFQFIDEMKPASEIRRLIFDDNGLQLVKGCQVVWGVDMKGDSIPRGKVISYLEEDCEEGRNKGKGKAKKKKSKAKTKVAAKAKNKVKAKAKKGAKVAAKAKSKVKAKAKKGAKAAAKAKSKVKAKISKKSKSASKSKGKSK